MMSFTAELAGRFAREALAAGLCEVCAAFRNSFYVRSPAERYACIVEASSGRGPLNVLVAQLKIPTLGEQVRFDLTRAQTWTPPAHAPGALDVRALREAARPLVPAEGLGCLIVGAHNSLSGHAQPALEALDRWLVGNALADDAGELIGLGSGVTPAGDDYLGGVLVALRLAGRGAQADRLWRWLRPRLDRTSPISVAHLEAAAAGEAHEALHEVLNADPNLEKLNAVGQTSGWDALAGALAVLG